MSEPIPESIPTSADPRIKRPVKKRALSPRAHTATLISSLFSKPDQPILIPSFSTSSTQHSVSQPPEIVQNVQGSSAGAGSGEFHVYKASRRREYERLRDMEAEVEREKVDEEWEREKRQREEKDREITKRKREKRERLKQKKAKGRPGDSSGSGVTQKVVYGDNGKRLLSTKEPDVIDALAEEVQSRETNIEEQTIFVEEAGLIIHDDD